MGYAGGGKENPTYHDLGDHSETVQIDFDPRLIAYEELLDIFWQSHNPSSPAWSTQYKHAVFCHNDGQKELALVSKERLEERLNRKILTEIIPYTGFYRAEDYHQKYKLRHAPELMAEFEKMYPDYGDFVDSTAAARVNGYLYGYGSLENLQAEINAFGLSVSAGERLLELMRKRDKRMGSLNGIGLS